MLWLLLALCLTSVTADPWARAEELFARTRRLNPTLADYRATVELKLDARMGPLTERRTLKGTCYYKREGRHKLDLPDAPSYLQKHSNVFGFSLPRLERYQVRKVEEAQLGGQPAWHLELVPRTPQGSIERLEMWLHRKEYTILEYDTYYSNGQALVGLTHVTVQRQRVPATISARFEFPGMGLSATVQAAYSGYQFNQGLSDRLFNAP